LLQVHSNNQPDYRMQKSLMLFGRRGFRAQPFFLITLVSLVL